MATERTPSTPIDRVRALADEHVTVAEETRSTLVGEIEAFGGLLGDVLEGGGKLVVFGNGGSAADAQHFAAELTGHFVAERGPLPAVALTTDTSALTAIGNDYEFAEVYARQVRALARPGDLVVGISTSGRAENVLRGVAAGHEAGVTTVALTGGTGGPLAAIADRALIVPSAVTARIQEMHILIIHIVCSLIDDRLAAGADAG
jgi:D-sedoheptulose 7-phosphate isomerase